MSFADDADPKDDPKDEGDDPRDTDITPEPEPEPEEKEETEEESEEEAEEEDSEEKAEPEGEKPEEKAAPEVDVSKIPLDELMKREDLKRFVQSVSDKAVAAAEKRTNEQRAKERDDARRRREEEELDELYEADDFEAAGKLQKERRVKAKQDAAESTKWIGEFSRSGELYYREVYADLGEETLDRVYAEMEGKPVFDLGSRLAEERLSKTMDAKISERVSAEVDAKLTAAGVAERSEKVEKKETASEKVSGSRKSKSVRTERTDGDWQDAYNDGDAAWEELPEEVKRKISR